MSFFNLTQLGPSDPFSSAREKPSSQPASPSITTQPKTIDPPPTSSAPCPSFASEMYGESSDHRILTSHKEFTNKRIKHQRNEKGTYSLYNSNMFCNPTSLTDVYIYICVYQCIHCRSNGII